ncbi:dipeptidase [Ahrensia sp. R2A130]|uniref:dipeptidase n=1 Tax=Ahrensia sp. R2A130 TaxID=744979 RepID=UPI0001E0ACD6|nr:dipeptidase [Ahrensia sp. R2A130]EFL88455.1 peptidase M20 [Ahrensia sp. R2A130]
MTDKLDAALDKADTNLDASVDRLFHLLRIPSISTDPAYKDDCKRAADTLVEQLNALGFDASAREVPGHPMVVAHHPGPKEGADKVPHVLFYGHYDVQPVDPIELWNTDPFEPTVVGDGDDAKIYARGSSDDKGQLLTFVEACRAWIETSGDLPLKVTLLFEGEEESGSPSLEPFLEAAKEELSCDLALVCDTSMWDENTPAITTTLRGMSSDELTLVAADRDLHSGYYGGAATNPIHVLSKIIADLHAEDGSVTLDGFYDGVEDVPEDVKRSWEKLDFSAKDFLGEVGLSMPSGEANRSVLEQTWSRPTAEINGITGGYTGEGFKTVIAAKASTKVSFRLVGQQDPDAVAAAFRKHVAERLPEDCEAHWHPHGRNPATQLAWDLPELQKAASALTDEWGKQAALTGGGGSIPIVGNFKRQLGMDSLLIGFALASDAIHSPNEKYQMKSFRKGIRSWVRVMDALAG